LVLTVPGSSGPVDFRASSLYSFAIILNKRRLLALNSSNGRILPVGTRCASGSTVEISTVGGAGTAPG
jgi:hypothetical protein